LTVGAGPLARISAAGALILTAGAGCAPKPADCGLHATVEPAATGVIIIVNDTMRRDRLGAYGGPALTPHFDAFARDNHLFERAFTQAPWTKPSVATLFTSLYPSQHGVLSHRAGDGPGVPAAGGGRTDVVGPDLTTIAEVLRDRGWKTAAFVGNPWLAKGLGFEQGFEVYDDSFAGWEAHGDRIADAASAWLAGLHPGEKFFLYLHFMESHRPYALIDRADLEEHAAALRADTRPLSAVGRDIVAKLVWLDEGIPAVQAGAPPNRTLLEMAYDRGIENFDGVLGRFLARFAQSPAWPRTAIVVTSDHGEALFERGWDNHGRGLYDDEVAIPFVARLPGVKPERSSCGCAMGLVDVAPTLYDYLGIEPPAPVFGRSLLRPAPHAAQPGGRVIVTEGVMSKPLHRAVRDDAHVLLFEPEGGPDGKTLALFDLDADPREQRDLLAPGVRTPDNRAIVRSLLERGRETVPPFATPDRTLVPLDPEIEKRLRSLGYL
jgi:arylsulfatase A-like enzyme